MVWSSRGSFGSDTSLQSIQGQRYDSSGNALGGEFQVNTYTPSSPVMAAVASDDDFVVAWASNGSSGSFADRSFESVKARRYDSSGAALGSEFLVNSYSTGAQYFPEVAVEPDGNFVVVWHSSGSFGSDTSARSIHGQRYRGAFPRENEFQVNSYTTGQQWFPDLALTPNGDFVVVWNSASNIQAQRYVQTSAVPSLSAPGFASAALALLLGTAWALRRRA